MVGFSDFKDMSDADLYLALTGLANARANDLGFTAAGQQMKDLADGLKDGILTKEDIINIITKEDMVDDFTEALKDDGISPEMINSILVDTFKVGKKYVLEVDQNGLQKGKYVDDNEPQEFEAFLRKPKEEVIPEVKEDFTEKDLMAKLKEKSDDLDKKYPELFGKDLTVDDAVALKEKLEKEKAELLKEKEGLGDNTEAIEKSFTDDFVGELLDDLDEEFTIDPKIRGNLGVKLSKVLYKKLYGE